MSEIFDTLAKEYSITRNGDGWTIINLSPTKDTMNEYDWCFNNIEVGNWTYSIKHNHVPQFWFRKESDATMFTLKWLNYEVAQ